MKKLYTLILMLVASTTMLFATEYPLQVNRVQVTDENKDHITGEGITGNISYDPVSKTLTVEDATLEQSTDFTHVYGIVSEVNGLTINFVGENHFNTNYAISLWADNTTCTVTGPGSLVSTGGMYIYGDETSITFKECNVELAEGTDVDGDVFDFEMNFIGANVKIAEIRDVSAFNMQNCQITAPAGAYYSSSRIPKGVYVADDLAQNIVISSTVGISENEQTNFSIYPNPASDYIFVNRESNDEIFIYNAAGSLVKSSNENRIDVSALSHGVYTVKCGNSTVKFVK